MAEKAWGEHEGVIGGSGGKPDIAVYALIGMDDGMDLDAALLLPRLRVTPHTLENGVGEKRDGGGINDPEPLNPLLRAVSSAVR